MNNRLARSSAVEDAYYVFSRYRIGADLDFAARVGASEEEHQRLRHLLRHTPPRALPADAIDAYFEYISAAHPDGAFNADQVRHFLPRALDILVSGAGRSGVPFLPDYLQCILERGSARSTWPVAEIEAIDRVLKTI